MRAAWILAALLAISAAAPAQDLRPRAVLPKVPARVPSAADLLPGLHPLEYQLAVKFTDDLRVRARPDGGLASLAGADLSGVDELAGRLGLQFSAHIALPEQELSALEARAALRSRVAQPDLAGLLRVTLRGSPSGTEPAALADAGNALLARPEVEFVSLQALGAPPPGDIAPPTPDLVPLQSYRGQAPGMNADAANAAGFDGSGLRLSDCEYGWVATHEDLVDIDLHLEPGQIIHPNVITFGWDEHGTAVMGETTSGGNGYGCSGMASGASVFTYPEWTLLGGFRILTCITNAIADSGAGDVVLLEMQSAAGGPVEADPTVWLVVKVGTDAGVVVVAAAGNGNQDLDGLAYAAWQALGDSGSILVGAGSANEAHDKLGFSSFGARVNVQGWGESVVSLGYGDYAQYGLDKNQRYTATFSGTSSASPFVASACLIAQQAAVVQLGAPLSPVALRQLLQDTGVPQGAGGHIGPFVDCARALAVLLPWQDVGGGLAGLLGVPALDGQGTLQAGDPLVLTLHGAAPLAPATMIIGLSAINLPLKGGTLVPAPDVIVPTLLTSPAGTQVLAGVAPQGLPPGFTFYVQSWIVDAGASKGVAATNGLAGTVPP